MNAAPVAIALGANLGDRRASLEAAVAELRALPGLVVRAVSSFHETAPVGGPPGQPDYLNAVVVGACELAPRALLHALQGIERRHGRDRAREPRFGPRTLDLDLLVFGDAVSRDEELELPHPRLLARRFVLAPLAEVAPELEIPGAGLDARAALAALEAREAAR